MPAHRSRLTSVALFASAALATAAGPWLLLTNPARAQSITTQRPTATQSPVAQDASTARNTTATTAPVATRTSSIDAGTTASPASPAPASPASASPATTASPATSPSPSPTPSGSTAPPASPTPASPAAAIAGRCRPQSAQPFLIRTTYTVPRDDTPAENRRCRRDHQAAIRYRTEHYGYFPGCGDPSWNPHPPSHYAERATFMGLPVRVNRRIVPALACVEAEIQRTCGHVRYRASHLAGIRNANSFHGGEVSNHVYGIAVDVDPDRNPCCGCGSMFRDHPGCTRNARTVWDRMAMPECWVQAFERYGFYWLGRDRALRDLMHFEFLGDPDRILE